MNIAIHLFSQAYQDTYDTAVIVSGDSDLVPAIQETKKQFPLKRFGVLFPYGQGTKELKKIADFNMRISIGDMRTAILPDTIVRIGKGTLYCPREWKSL